MPEKLMRWNGSEWIEVMSLVRNEVTTVIGLQKKLLGDITVSLIEPAYVEKPVLENLKPNYDYKENMKKIFKPTKI